MYTISEIEDGIVNLLKESIAYCSKIDTFQFEGEDEEEEIRIIAKTLPCILIVYEGGPYKNLQMVSDHEMTFWILAADQSLRGAKEARRGSITSKGVYQMLFDIRAALNAKRPKDRDGNELQVTNLLALDEKALINSKGFSAYYIRFKTTARHQFNT